MIKYCAAILLLISSASACAQSEKQCQSSGKLAAATAEMMQAGASEEYVIEILSGTASDNPKRPKARQKIMLAKQAAIATYVFTMRLAPSEARSAVYTKCMAGGLGYIDWSKHPEAY